jgi:hypothetical protein
MITSNTNNPWVDLPSEPPYIAPVDTSGLLKVGKRADGLRFDVIPDPYFGDINQAEIVVLPLNPGFEDADLLVNMQRDEYVTQNRLSLKHKSSPPLPMGFFRPYMQLPITHLPEKQVLASLASQEKFRNTNFLHSFA